MARKGHTQGNGGCSNSPAIADNGKIGDEPSVERAVESDTIKTANVKVAQVTHTHSEERAMTLESGEMKPAEANRAEKSGPPTAEKQRNPDKARRPARMANADLMCFANSVIRVIDSIPELRDRLIAKATLNDDPAFPAFPTRTESKKADEKAEAQWYTKISRILREQNRTSVTTNQYGHITRWMLTITDSANAWDKRSDTCEQQPKWAIQSVPVGL